jgi:hypothetical protein
MESMPATKSSSLERLGMAEVPETWPPTPRSLMPPPDRDDAVTAPWRCCGNFRIARNSGSGAVSKKEGDRSPSV